MTSSKNNKMEQSIPHSDNKKPVCGIVRPIAAMDSYSESHWQDVHNILVDAIESAGFTPNLVSNSIESHVIQKTIIQNLFSNELVICDISGKNPNVMLELGMRLAFDKPTIVIKDYATPFSFDTSPMEHLLYREDLRYASILEFKSKLAEKITATYEKSINDPNYSSYLKQFGTYTVAKLEQKEVSKEDFIIDQLKTISNEVAKLKKPENDPWDSLINKATDLNFEKHKTYIFRLPAIALSRDQKDHLLKRIREHEMIFSARLLRSGPSYSIEIVYSPDTPTRVINLHLSNVFAEITSEQ